MAAAVAASLASGGVESVHFLNDIVEQLWDYINVAGSAMAKELIEPMFKDLLPGPLKSLRFVKIDLGRTPVKFHNVDVHTPVKGSIKLDVDITWDGNCDIDLKTDLLGTFGVQGVKIRGRVSVLLQPLVDRLPLVSAAQIAFINPPDLELDFTGLAQLADLSIIDDTTRKIIDDIVTDIIVLPNRLLCKIDPANDFFKSYQQQLGFLRLTVVSGTGFKVAKGFIKDVPDCYCKVRVGGSKIWKTSTKKNDVTPEWNETKDFLLSDHDQIISVVVWDDDLASDDNLGCAKLTVGDLLLAGRTKVLRLKIGRKSSSASVTIKCDILPFVQDVSSFGAREHKGRGLKCGLVTILVAGVAKIPGKKNALEPSIKVAHGKDEFYTPVVYNVVGCDPVNPVFDFACRIPLTRETAAQASDFLFTLLNCRAKMDRICIPFAKVIAAPNHCLVGKPTFDNGAELHVSISISGVTLAP